MATFSALLLFSYILCGFVHAAEDFYTIPVRHEKAHPGIENILRSRQSASLPSVLGRSLYWFAHFSVGDSPDLKLLIDTGSTDLLVDPGLYHGSKHEKPYQGHSKFSITYEGVNRAGFGFETLNGTVHRDIVTAGGLTVIDHPIGNITSYKYFDVGKEKPNVAIQGQGIIGFGPASSSSFKPEAPSWFYNLCHNKAISACKLGLVFGTSGKGLTVIGKLAKNLIQGKLTTVPYHSDYFIKGDVTVGGKIVARNQTIIMDVGTDNIQGPIEETKKIFQLLGFPSFLHTESTNSFNPGEPIKVLNGFFPCNEPPTLGFSFPAEADLRKGQKAQNFNVSPKVWNVFDNGNNNCTSILGGTNALTNPKTGASAWLLGQSFFAGHYVDFDVDHKMMGFGDLKDPSMASA